MAKVEWTVDYNEMVYDEKLGVNIYKRIPFEKKEEFAHEFTNRSIVFDDNGFAEKSMYHTIVMQYLIMKYYTDAEIDEDTAVKDVYEWMIVNNAVGVIMDICRDDFETTKNMTDDCTEFVIDAWKRRHSLESFVSSAFDDNIVQAIADDRAVNDAMMELIHNSEKKDNKAKMLANFAKKEV